MILFTILILMIIMLTLIAIIAFGMGGTMFILVFGDVIVCIALLIWIAKRLHNRKKKQESVKTLALLLFSIM